MPYKGAHNLQRNYTQHEEGQNLMYGLKQTQPKLIDNGNQLPNNSILQCSNTS